MGSVSLVERRKKLNQSGNWKSYALQKRNVQQPSRPARDVWVSVFQTARALEASIGHDSSKKPCVIERALAI